MRLAKSLVLLAVALSLAGACTSEKPDENVVDGIYVIKELPYNANPVRRSRIHTGRPKLREGMDPDTVIAIMGAPNEVIDNLDEEQNKVGFHYTYVVQRMQDFGSDLDRAEILFKVNFDSSNKLTTIDEVGL